MIHLPLQVPELLRDRFYEKPTPSNLNELLHVLAEVLVSVLCGKASVAAIRIPENEEEYIQAATGFDLAPAGLAQQFLSDWQSSNIHQEILRDMVQRVDCHSLSEYHWRFPCVDDEETYQSAKWITVPAEQALLFPISSALLVQHDDEVEFFGYLAILSGPVTEVTEMSLQLIATLPEMLSEIVATFVREHAQTYESVGTFAHDVKHYLLIQSQLLSRLADAKECDRVPLIKRLQKMCAQLVVDASVKLQADKDRSGMLVSSPLSLSLNEIVQESMTTIQPLFDASTVDVSINLSTPLPDADIDPAIFPSVVQNILDNALKYAEKNSVVTVTTRSDDESVELEVTNVGEAIPEDMHEEIFKKYSRLANTSHIPGSGLGLYLARRIVELHHGSIEVSNGEDGTVCFTVLLPVGEGCANKRGGRE